jgi:hypothetical protein
VKPIPLASDLALRHFVFLIFRNDLVEEVEEAAKALQFPVVIFTEILELLAELFRQHDIKLDQGILCRGLSEGAFLF